MPDADLPLGLPALPAGGGQRDRHRRLLLGAAVVLSALVGGGSAALLTGSSPTTLTAASPAPSPPAPPAPTGAAAGPAPAEPPPAVPSGSATEAVPGVLLLSGEAASFRTPSGNIGCQLTSSAASCDVLERSWDLPPPPADCELDYGQGAFVDGDRAGLACASDTPFDPAAPVLAYGSGWQLGEVRCLSARDGVTCEHTVTGRGFAVSREEYRLF